MSYGYNTAYGGVTGTPGMMRSPGVPMFNPGQLDAFRAKLATLGIDDPDSALHFLDQGAELKQQPYLMKQDLKTMGYGALTGTDVSGDMRSMAFKSAPTRSMFKNGGGVGAAEGGGNIETSGPDAGMSSDLIAAGGGNPKTKAAIGALSGL